MQFCIMKREINRAYKIQHEILNHEKHLQFYFKFSVEFLKINNNNPQPVIIIVLLI